MSQPITPVPPTPMPPTPSPPTRSAAGSSSTPAPTPVPTPAQRDCTVLDDVTPAANMIITVQSGECAGNIKIANDGVKIIFRPGAEGFEAGKSIVLPTTPGVIVKFNLLVTGVNWAVSQKVFSGGGRVQLQEASIEFRDSTIASTVSDPIGFVGELATNSQFTLSTTTVSVVALESAGSGVYLYQISGSSTVTVSSSNISVSCGIRNCFGLFFRAPVTGSTLSITNGSALTATSSTNPAAYAIYFNEAFGTESTLCVTDDSVLTARGGRGSAVVYPSTIETECPSVGWGNGSSSSDGNGAAVNDDFSSNNNNNNEIVIIIVVLSVVVMIALAVVFFVARKRRTHRVSAEESEARRRDPDTSSTPVRDGGNDDENDGAQAVQSQDSDSSRYQVHYNRQLGVGGFGVVYKGYDSKTGITIAVKESKLHTVNAKELESLKKEYELIKSLHHPNIVTVYGIHIEEENSICRIFMEYMSQGSILTIMEDSRFRLYEESLRRYLRSTLDGLVYLHGNKVLHRDIKPANILVDKGIAKLSDFGLSRSSLDGDPTTTPHVVGTCAYLSPEAIKGRFGEASDIWALGCSVVEMATGRPPWSHLDAEQRQPMALMFRIGTATAPDHHPEIPEHLSPELKGLIESMFNLECKKRPSAHQLRSDPYFDDRQDVPVKFESRDSFNSALARSISGVGKGYILSPGKGEEYSELTEWAGATGEMPMSGDGDGRTASTVPMSVVAKIQEDSAPSQKLNE